MLICILNHPWRNRVLIVILSAPRPPARDPPRIPRPMARKLPRDSRRRPVVQSPTDKVALSGARAPALRCPHQTGGGDDIIIIDLIFDSSFFLLIFSFYPTPILLLLPSIFPIFPIFLNKSIEAASIGSCQQRPEVE